MEQTHQGPQERDLQWQQEPSLLGAGRGVPEAGKSAGLACGVTFAFLTLSKLPLR